MACTLCRLETPETLCEVCRYLTEGIPPDLPVACEKCGAPMENPAKGARFCQLCLALLQTIQRNAWMVHAHTEWQRENFLLARRKRELMGKEDTSGS